MVLKWSHLPQNFNPFGKRNLFLLQKKQDHQEVVGHELCFSQIYASLKRQQNIISLIKVRNSPRVCGSIFPYQD